MFDQDKWQEIFHSIKKNKLRAFLTMFGVFWGLFMLMLLLGSGKGLENGVKKGFDSWATNSGFVWTRRTTMPHDGFKPGRFIRFELDDVKALKQNVEGLQHICPRNQLGGFMGGNNVVRNNKTGAFSIYGDMPEYQEIQKVDVTAGRHLNPLDIEEKRKVAVIGKSVTEQLFESHEDPINQYIKINGIFFKVIGTFQSKRTGEDAERDTQSIYIPFTAFNQAFSYGNRVGWFAFSAMPNFPVSTVEENIKKVLRERHHVHPEDEAAIGSANLEEEYNQLNGLFTGISVFVWIVGIGTLLAGIIGVSNIMLIIVKERTKEIGIRKSLGATPASIISLIIQESVFITAVAGYVGLFLGILLIETISYALESNGVDTGFFGRPEINLTVASSALIVLIFSGVLAGLFPASKASKINPIEALRTE
jgi:putative ABC transport system permease protein